VARNVAERISVDERLRALGIEPADSQANFCWFSLGPERDELQFMRGLEERGVLVRGGGALGEAGSLRVTYGTPEENARFLDALAEVL
jgi:histidinol-phosphate aminotransferase